jgi:hypothetical protein
MLLLLLLLLLLLRMFCLVPYNTVVIVVADVLSCVLQHCVVADVLSLP